MKCRKIGVISGMVQVNKQNMITQRNSMGAYIHEYQQSWFPKPLQIVKSGDWVEYSAFAWPAGLDGRCQTDR